MGTRRSPELCLRLLGSGAEMVSVPSLARDEATASGSTPRGSAKLWDTSRDENDLRGKEDVVRYRLEYNIYFGLQQNSVKNRKMDKHRG
jgi:hypothetical protein